MEATSKHSRSIPFADVWAEAAIEPARARMHCGCDEHPTHHVQRLGYATSMMSFLIRNHMLKSISSVRHLLGRSPEAGDPTSRRISKPCDSTERL